MALSPFFETKDEPLVKASRAKTARRNTGAGGCEACGLYKQCASPKMEAFGKGKKGILILAEAPGSAEDRKGIPLSGKLRDKLSEELDHLGVDLDRDCRMINAVNCRRKGEKGPTDKEIAYCRHRVLAEIKEFQPKVILALGGAAMKSLCQHRSRWEYGFPSIMQWQGEIIPDQEFGCWVAPTWHPEFMDKMENHPVYERKWRADLKQAVEYSQKEAPKQVDYQSFVEVVVSPGLAVAKLKEVYEYLLHEEDPSVTFDWETTGLKPYVEGHKIVCVSFSWADDKSLACLATPETWPWIERILRSPKIGKEAHHMKFEKNWARVRGGKDGAGFQVNNWQWDSMLAAHILDNRTGRAGLKFQAYVKFGVLGYDDSVGPYLKADSANGFNRIHEVPVRDLLLYCGMDSILERHLSNHQKPLIHADKGLVEAYQLMHEGALALSDAEFNGIEVDLAYYQKTSAHLERRISQLRKKILEYDEVKVWQKMMGDKFNLNSSPQLAKLFSEKLEVKIEKQTASGNVSVDKEVLENIDLPFVKDLLQIRKLEKIKTTYLAGYMNEAPDGHLHPFFHLHKVTTFRSSSSEPNFQNVPKREPEAVRIVRSGLKTPLNLLWGEFDYSGIEVRISTTYHQDPTMIAYLRDPHSDMHRDAAMDLFILPEEWVTKPLRQGGKNGFVFPQFYGDYYGNNAPHLWTEWVCNPDNNKLPNGMTVKEWLATQRVVVMDGRKRRVLNGIKTLEQFTMHVEQVEHKLWYERFPVYREWRESIYKEYMRKGYIRAHTGFIYRAIMGKNDSTNYGTQGAAFHCLLWSFTQLNERLKREGWRSYLMGQIHDSLEVAIHPDEINELLPVIRGVMVDDLMKRFKWINVPMEIECELSPLGQSWYELKQVLHRPTPCECGLEWGYQKKPDTGGLRWSCPVCEHIQIERN